MNAQQRSVITDAIGALVVTLNADTELRIKEIVEAAWPSATAVHFEYENEDNAGVWVFLGVRVPGDDEFDAYGEDEVAADQVNALLCDIYDVHDDPWIAAGGARYARSDRPVDTLGER